MNQEFQKMIFVVGNSRSGTTMLGRMLGRNSRVYKFPELHLFGPCIPHGEEFIELSREKCIEAFTWLLDVAERKLHASRTPEVYHEEAVQLCNKYFRPGMNAWHVYHDFVMMETQRRQKSIPCEDLPGNVFKIDQILKMFPMAAIIHIVRDPRDVLLSQKNRHQRRKLGGGYVKRREMLRFWANYHPQFISRLWKNAVKAGLSYSGKEVFTVHFEKLISDPEKVLEEICLHCEIEYQSDMLNVPQVGSSMRKDAPESKGIDSTRSGSWRKGGLNPEEVEICEQINSDLMIQLGYEKSNLKGSILGRLRLAILLPIKAICSLILNWGRTKGRWNYLLKRFASP